MKSARNILHLGLNVHKETITIALRLSLRTPGTEEPKPGRFYPPTLLTQPTAKVFTQTRDLLGDLARIESIGDRNVSGMLIRYLGPNVRELPKRQSIRENLLRLLT